MTFMTITCIYIYIHNDVNYAHLIQSLWIQVPSQLVLSPLIGVFKYSGGVWIHRCCHLSFYTTLYHTIYTTIYSYNICSIDSKVAIDILYMSRYKQIVYNNLPSITFYSHIYIHTTNYSMTLSKQRVIYIIESFTIYYHMHMYIISLMVII